MQIWTYIDTNSRKLNQVKIVIIICQTAQIRVQQWNKATVVQSLLFNCRGINIDTGLSAYKQFYK